jgi:hypothetical protein
MICCGPLDDGYETEKIKALSLRFQSVGRLVQVCISLSFFFKKIFDLTDVVLPNSQDRESQSNEGTLDDLQEHARKLLASTTTQGIGQVRREDDEDVPIGCREAVEILTRNPKKSMLFLLEDVCAHILVI